VLQRFAALEHATFSVGGQWSEWLHEIPPADWPVLTARAPEGSAPTFEGRGNPDNTRPQTGDRIPVLREWTV
jgi:hypothetical protein